MAVSSLAPGLTIDSVPKRYNHVSVSNDCGREADYLRRGIRSCPIFERHDPAVRMVLLLPGMLSASVRWRIWNAIGDCVTLLVSDRRRIE